MKLAEALLLRADLQKKLASLKQRIGENVKVQDGDEPSENPTELLIQSSQIIGELYALIGRIHRTNAVVVLDNGKTMLTVLNERDELTERHRLLQSAIDNAKTEGDRYSFREIKWQKAVDISGLQKQADDISVKLRQVNVYLQSANWQVDLLD
ncbi:DIP1984 family protein [Faucicola mancuniensis]|uniref:DIP1984 family protein n=1 Tax=Faucicola mancuniensis TaxID=1309795 RepID=UPI00397777FB